MYEFQPPQNINAIRCSIARRIKEQREKYKKEEELKNKTRLSTLAATVTTATTDNGLPSPPVEACHYEPFKRPEEEEQDHPNNELDANALLELSGAGTPPSSSASVDSTNTQTPFLDEKIIRQKIQELQQEKHELFQLMKTLLSRPTPSPSAAVIATPEQVQPRSPHTPSPQVTPRVLPTPPSLQQTRASKPPPVQTKQHLNEQSKSRERLRSCSNGRARTPPTSLPSATSCTSPTSRPPAIRTAPPTDHYHHHRFPPPRYAPYRRMSPPSSSRYYSRSYGNSANSNSNGSSSNSRLYNNPPLSAPPFPPSSSSSSMPYAHRRIPLPYGSLRAQSPPLRSNFRPSRPMADRHIPRY